MPVPPAVPLRIALDLCQISISRWGHRRLLNLVHELDRHPDSLSLELIAEPVPELTRYPWSAGNRLIPPGSRIQTQVIHFLTGEVYPLPGCRTVVSLDAPVPLCHPGVCFKGREEESAYRNRLELILQTADWIITNSEFSYRAIISLHPQVLDRLSVIPPGIDPAFFPEPWGVEDRVNFRWNIGLERGFLLHTGGVDVLSGLDFLLESYRFYREMESTPRKLVITGDPGRSVPGRSTLQEKVAEYGLTGEVILTGHVSDDFLRRLYCSAALVVHPARGGSLGFTPLEAMVCGCPVLCSDAGVLAERAGQAAMILPVQNPEMWASKQVELLEDRNLRVDLVRKGLEHVRGFTWQRMAHELMVLYRQLVERM